MDKVKELVATGLSIPSAVKAALELRGLTVIGFAGKYEFPQSGFSSAINGGSRPTDAQVAALIAELGGTEAEWRELLWQAGKPDSVPAA